MIKETKLQKKNIILLFGIIALIFIGIFRNQISALFSIFYLYIGFIISTFIERPIKKVKVFIIFLPVFIIIFYYISAIVLVSFKS